MLLGRLGWPPSEVARADLRDILPALSGYAEAQAETIRLGLVTPNTIRALFGAKPIDPFAPESAGTTIAKAMTPARLAAFDAAVNAALA